MKAAALIGTSLAQDTPVRGRYPEEQPNHSSPAGGGAGGRDDSKRNLEALDQKWRRGLGHTAILRQRKRLVWKTNILRCLVNPDSPVCLRPIEPMSFLFQIKHFNLNSSGRSDRRVVLERAEGGKHRLRVQGPKPEKTTYQSSCSNKYCPRTRHSCMR